MPVIAHEIAKQIEIVYEVAARCIGRSIPNILLVVLGHCVKLVVCRLFLKSSRQTHTVEIRTRYGLLAILVVQEKGHGWAGAEAVWREDGLAQCHDASRPAIIQQAGDPKLGDFLDYLVVVGSYVEVLVVAKLSTNAQIGTAPNRVTQIAFAACND